FRHYLELVLRSVADGSDHDAARLSRRRHPARISDVAKQFHRLAVDLALYDFVYAGTSHEHPSLCPVDHWMRLDKGRLQDDKTVDIVRHAIEEYVDWLGNSASARLSRHQSKEGRCKGERAQLRAGNPFMHDSRVARHVVRHTLRPRKNSVRFA